MKQTMLFLFLIFSFSATAANDICSEYRMTNRQAGSVAPPERYAASFLWKIRPPGKSATPSYLLGSFHNDGPDITNLGESLIVLLGQMRHFVAETSFTPTAIQEFGKMTLTKEARLEENLGPEFFRPTAAILKDMPVERLKPWAAFLFLAKANSKSQSLDALLFNQSVKSGLQVVALQSPAEMAASIERLSLAEQVRIARETICNRDLVLAQAAELERLYTADDVQGFIDESQRLDSAQAGLAARMQKVLVEDRNKIFWPRLEPLLKDGATFVAVGAAHLYGANGLLARLSASGYRLEAVNRDKIALRLLAESNAAAEGAVKELIAFLRDRKFAPINGFATPEVRFLPTAKLERLACGRPCWVAMHAEDGKIYVSLELYHDLRRRSPQVMIALLAQIVRQAQLAQSRAVGDLSCASWHAKNVRAVVLQSQYLSGRGLPTAGLDPLEKPSDCTY